MLYKIFGEEPFIFYVKIMNIIIRMFANPSYFDITSFKHNYFIKNRFKFMRLVQFKVN